MSGFIKVNPQQRGGSRSLSDQAKRAMAAAKGGGFKVIEGQFNGFYPREDKALWFAICPGQSWAFDLYDRETSEVVHLEDQLYYSYVGHYVPATKRNFQCSATAHKNKPCWGCGIRNHFYENKRKRKEKTGVDPKGEPPISAMTNYAFAGVLLETVAKVPVKDKQGKARTNKNGETILKEIPVSLLPPQEARQLKKQGATSFGLRCHYALGITHLNALIDFDDVLKDYCTTCGEKLYASRFACPDCGVEQEESDEDGNPFSGQALKEMRGTDYKCDCGYFGPLMPLVECTCENPVEGKLVDFAVKLLSKKVGEKQRVLEIVEVRPIHTFIEKHPEVQDMLDNPLKLDEIFAPTRLESQTYMIPENLRGDGVTPSARAQKNQMSKPYPLEGEPDPDNDEEEEDDDADDE